MFVKIVIKLGNLRDEGKTEYIEGAIEAVLGRRLIDFQVFAIEIQSPSLLALFKLSLYTCMRVCIYYCLWHLFLCRRREQCSGISIIHASSSLHKLCNYNYCGYAIVYMLFGSVNVNLYLTDLLMLLL